MSAIIVGGGIGGLTTALTLHARGLACVVFEQSRNPRELGVGINILPPAVDILAKLGLLGQLSRVGIKTRSLVFATKSGQLISRTPRGLDAGFNVPQISIHRGRLLGVLLAAVRSRLGPDGLVTGCRLEAVEQQPGEVLARFRDRTTNEIIERTADCLIGADGIHSTTRSILNPDEAPPTWSGYMMWRGATPWPAWEDGRTMLVAGGLAAKFVFYPIADNPAVPDRRLTNWAVMKRVAREGSIGHDVAKRESWTRQAHRRKVEAVIRDAFDIGFIDVAGLIGETAEIFEFPLLERLPLERWSRGRVTLLGDAAHPMYPVGSNGATQAIIDAQSLAESLAREPSHEAALKRYEAERRPATNALVIANRGGGPERIIDLVEARAPLGFNKLGEVLSSTELAEFGIR